MRKYILFIVSLLLIPATYAQTNISGVINIYTVVDSVNNCSNQVYTTSAAGFSVGDRVLLIQMKGAQVNLTNTASFGNLTAYNNAGNYELATISAISGSVISFQNGILRNYTALSAIQLVRVPVYGDVNIVGTLSAADWNGSTGGILAFKADMVTFSADIDVSGKGFRGGNAGNYPSSCPTGTGTSLYYSDTLSGKGGAKGEGIVILTSGYLACRGKAFNGGGGGNDHNAGGGGGANGGGGGVAGENDEAFFSCPGSPGFASLAPDQTMAADKLFLGGGGGAGHGNNNNGTDGGDGGGLVLIEANQIIGNSHSIISNGVTVPSMAWGDGAGGGGAGGTIALVCPSVSALTISANGGKGGDTGADQCTGPGGGGSGGVLKHYGATIWPGVIVNLNGGTFGTNITATSDCFGLNNGAAAGSTGSTISNFIAAESITPYVADFANAGSDVTVCNGGSIMLNASGGVSYSWSPATYLDNPAISNPTCTPLATTNYVVTVTNANGCTDIDNITVTLAPPAVANAGDDISICSGESTTLNGSGGVSYSWSPSIFLDDAFAANPIASPLIDIIYTLTVTDINGCVGTDEVAITVNSSNFLTTSGDVDACGGGDVMLHAAGADSYLWTPSTYLDDPTSANPICSPLTDITYTITAISTEGCVDVDSLSVNIIPAAFLNAGDDVSTCTGADVILNATGGVVFHWSPSTYLDDADIASPTCTPLSDIIYIVTSETADGCTDTDTISVSVLPSDFADVDATSPVCTGTSTTLHASGGTTYNWSPSTYLDDATVANPVCTPLTDITYFVSVTNADGCVDVDTVTVNTIPSPVITAGPDTTVCFGGQIKLFVTEGVAYNWTPATFLDYTTIESPTASPTATISYIVYVTDASGCIGSDTVDIIVNSIPDITASADITICRGDTATLTAVGGVEYTWTPDPLIPCIDCSSIDVAPTSTTTYIVQGIDANGCSATDEVTVTVDICDAINNILAEEIQIFPNPTTGNFQISYPKFANFQSLELFNLIGEKVNCEVKSDQSNITVKVAESLSGQLLLLIRFDEGTFVEMITILGE